MATESPTALLFPGQGSQTPEMRDTVARVAPELIELATSEVGEDPFVRLDDGTRFVQPALYCGSVAAWIDGGRPDAEVFAGHSLGELAALAAAGAVDLTDGLRIAAARGRLMDDAASRDSDGGAMLAVLGDDDQAREIADEAGVAVANDNAPGQIVLSGRTDSIEAAAELAKDRGLRAVRLNVAGAFHSSAMQVAVPDFLEVLAGIEFTEPRAPVLSGVTTKPFDDGVRDQLAAGLTNPVRWRETLIAMQAQGITRFVEVGPGKVLRNLVRRTLDDVEAYTLADLEAIGA